MFLVFSLLLLSLWVWLFLSVYSSFFPFLQSIGNISDYNVAYYAALSSVERGELAIKYRAPWFQWSGGVLSGNGWWPMSDQWSFLITSSTQGNWRDVNSRTTTIPSSGVGNSDVMLQSADSKDYNALRYQTLETLILSIDSTTNPEEYYSGNIHHPSYYSGIQMTWVFRLPSVVYSWFGNVPALADLCALQSVCDFDGDQVNDDIMVNWNFKWSYNVASFLIMPSMSVFYYGSNKVVNYPKDNAIRASLFGTSVALSLTDYSPVGSLGHGDVLSWHTLLSPNASTLQQIPFETFLGWWAYSNLEFSFGLTSLLRSFGWGIYPYLEYQFTFPQAVADRFYTIDGHGRNRDYDVQIQIKKPTAKWSVGGDFTVIF